MNLNVTWSRRWRLHETTPPRRRRRGRTTVYEAVSRRLRSTQASDARVARLAEFQSKALRAALTRFPRAERVSYSTCSLRVEEDEAVVAGALADVDIRKGGWRLAPALPAWPRRGRPHAGLDRAQSDCLARAEPAADATGAFFVALFERSAGAARKRRRRG